MTPVLVQKPAAATLPLTAEPADAEVGRVAATPTRREVDEKLAHLARCLGRQAARRHLSRGWSIWELAVAITFGALVLSGVLYVRSLHGG